jgi:nucleotide-binding universal stress UspA family protein
MFQHILHPTDGSDQCQQALETAIEMAKAFQGHITLVHAYEFLQSTNPTIVMCKSSKIIYTNRVSIS